MARKKQEIALQVEVETQEEWEEMLSKEGLTVVDTYQEWAGPCKAMLGNFRRLKNELGDDLLRFAVAKTDTVDALERYRGKCEPCFLFFAGGVLVAQVRSANSPLLLRSITEQLAHEHKVLEGNAERKEIKDPLLADVDKDQDEEEEAEEEGEDSDTKHVDGSPSETASKPSKSDTNGSVDDSLLGMRHKGEHIIFEAMPELADEEEGEERKKGVTVAIIKPNVVEDGKVDEVIEQMKAAGIDILENEERQMTEEQAREFYSHKKEEEYFEDLIKYMTSGPCHVLVITKGDTGEGIIDEWRDLLGPASMDDAKEQAPDSLRAKYGRQESYVNALHGSDSEDTATRELGFFFPNYTVPTVPGSGKKPKIQRTLALVRPDALKERKDEILAKITEAGFTVALQKEIQLSKEQAEEFYKEHKEHDYFEELTTRMSNGPLLALGLAREDAVEGWRDLLGPKEVDKAKEEAPDSLRAQFSVDDVPINQLHGSDTPESAKKELEYFFPMQQTMAVIKPDAYQTKDEIMSRIREAGFHIAARKETELTKEIAQQFYQDLDDKEYFEELTEHMTSGPTLFMVLSREDAVEGWRSLIGPTDPGVAKEQNQDTLRAKFGTDIKANAVHGSSNKEQVERGVRLIFEASSPKESETSATEGETQQSEQPEGEQQQQQQGEGEQQSEQQQEEQPQGEGEQQAEQPAESQGEGEEQSEQQAETQGEGETEGEQRPKSEAEKQEEGGEEQTTEQPAEGGEDTKSTAGEEQQQTEDAAEAYSDNYESDDDQNNKSHQEKSDEDKKPFISESRASLASGHSASRKSTMGSAKGSKRSLREDSQSASKSRASLNQAEQASGSKASLDRSQSKSGSKATLNQQDQDSGKVASSPAASKVSLKESSVSLDAASNSKVERSSSKVSLVKSEQEEMTKSKASIRTAAETDEKSEQVEKSNSRASLAVSQNRSKASLQKIEQGSQLTLQNKDDSATAEEGDVPTESADNIKTSTATSRKNSIQSDSSGNSRKDQGKSKAAPGSSAAGKPGKSGQKAGAPKGGRPLQSESKTSFDSKRSDSKSSVASSNKKGAAKPPAAPKRASKGRLQSTKAASPERVESPEVVVEKTLVEIQEEKERSDWKRRQEEKNKAASKKNTDQRKQPKRNSVVDRTQPVKPSSNAPSKASATTSKQRTDEDQKQDAEGETKEGDKKDDSTSQKGDDKPDADKQSVKEEAEPQQEEVVTTETKPDDEQQEAKTDDDVKPEEAKEEAEEQETKEEEAKTEEPKDDDKKDDEAKDSPAEQTEANTGEEQKQDQQTDDKPEQQAETTGEADAEQKPASGKNSPTQKADDAAMEQKAQ